MEKSDNSSTGPSATADPDMESQNATRVISRPHASQSSMADTSGEEAGSTLPPTGIDDIPVPGKDASGSASSPSAGQFNSTSNRVTQPDTYRHNTGQQPLIAAVGTVLKDRFVLEELIARGGMGVVYKARDLRKEEYRDREPYVAIKVLGEECKTHPDFFLALQRETRKAQKLAHPNIVTVYDFDCDGDTVFMTMEYLVGQTLDKYIRDHQSGRLDRKTAFSIIRDMSQGLAYAHKKGIVHSDFKPGNVFLTDDGNAKILDFGISRVATQPDKRSQDATIFDAGKFGALTPPYASCEMLEKANPDPRDDIYALACVSYELLAGKHPFNKITATVARNKRLKPARIKGLNKNQWKGLLHGLAFKRTARIPTVDRFLQDIDGGYQFMGLPRGWQVMAGLALTLLITGAFLLPYMAPHEDRGLASRDSVLKSEAEGTYTAPILLSAEQYEKIGRLLEVAEVHHMVGRITEPPGSNAYDAYRQVLEINPHNADAIAGLSRIADHYQMLATEKLNAGELEDARALIKAGLEVQPWHPGLTRLDEESSDNEGWIDRIISLVADLF